MIHRVWRLSESGETNLGLACTEDGLMLGGTRLVERCGGRFMVRERGDIERLLSRAYRINIAADRLMKGLETVAAALNANDRGMACIAAVHLQIPDLPDYAAREEMEAEDRLILRREARRAFQKASPDDPKHPGWPKGTEGGRGGKFRPKTGAEAPEQPKTETEIAEPPNAPSQPAEPPELPAQVSEQVSEAVKLRAMRLALRRGARIVAVASLHMIPEAATNLIPFLDVAGDIALAYDTAQTILEFKKLAAAIKAASDFVKQGPHTLQELEIPINDIASNGYEDFSTFEALKKGDTAIELLEKRFGPAGDGWQYHHIVTQGGENEENIPAQQLHNTENVIRLPTLLHEVVNAEYLKPAEENSEMSLYEWLQTQPYDVQRERGLQILRDLRILK
jgi:hypothetical protein